MGETREARKSTVGVPRLSDTQHEVDARNISPEITL